MMADYPALVAQLLGEKDKLSAQIMWPYTLYNESLSDELQKSYQ